jgi:hypothetical protein
MGLAVAVVALAGACAGEGETPVGMANSICAHEPVQTQVAPACNRVANSAPIAAFQAGNSDPPVPYGGALLDGLYQSNNTQGWGAVPAQGRRTTLAVLGGGTQFLWNSDILDGDRNVIQSFRASSTAVVSGTEVLLNTDCSSVDPSPIPPAVNFTASGSELLLLVIDGGDVMLTSYIRTGCPQ